MVEVEVEGQQEQGQGQGEEQGQGWQVGRQQGKWTQQKQQKRHPV